MASEFTRVNQATELAIGRNPDADWYLRRTPQGSRSDHQHGPQAGSSNVGIALQNTVSCYIHVSPTLKAEGITVMAQLAEVNFDNATTYTLNLSATAMPSGSAYTAVGQGTRAATVDKLAADINAAPPANTTAVTIDMDNDGKKDTIVVHTFGAPPAAPALFVDFSVSGGTGAWTSVTIDADTVSIKPWLKIKDRSAGAPLEIPWAVPRGETWPLVVSGDGYTARLNVAGYDRLYVEEVAVVERTGNGASVGAHYALITAPAIQEE